MTKFVIPGDYEASEAIIQECFAHSGEPEDKCNLLQLRSRNRWLRNNLSEALNDTLLALKILGIEVNPAPTRREADIMFELVKNEILAVGFDEILAMPRTTDKRTELAVMLLNEAGQYLIPCMSSTLICFLEGINAYWSSSSLAFTDVVGLTVRYRVFFLISSLTQPPQDYPIIITVRRKNLVRSLYVYGHPDLECLRELHWDSSGL